MKLFLTRHGETDHNLNRRYQGQMDVYLNQTGIHQADLLAKRLGTEKIDAIIASDLSRTTETARAICAFRKNSPAIQTDPRWRELSFGKWEGLDHREIKAQWQGEAEAWYADIVHTAPPGGESLSQLSKRVDEALEDLKSAHKDETVLLVTHGGVIQTLMCLVLGIELNRYWQFRVLQASLTIVDFHEESAILHLFNDISHLESK